MQPRSSGPAGAEVTVSALGFDPGRAEIRWNAADGELLASGNGPDFSERVTIPNSDEGLYHLVVLARSPGGEIGNTATVSFHVTAPGAAPAAPAWPAQRPPAANSAPSASEGPSSAALLTGGVALLSMGGLAGNLLARRRRGPAPVG